MTPDTRPDLSIVIVNWNTQQLLREVLQSVHQTQFAISAEVIVVDNGSADGSPEMTRGEFPGVILICNSENRGFSAANNQGFEVARGRHVLLLNSDTVVLGDVLAASVRYLDSHLNVGAMGCRVLNTDRTLQRTCSRFPGPMNMLLLTLGLWKLKWPAALRGVFGRYQMVDWERDSERDVEVVTGCYLMLRHQVLQQVGPLDESFFFFGEETDLCRRISDAGWSVRFAPVGEIIHHGSASARKLSYRRDILLTDALVRINRKHGGMLAASVVWATLFGFNLSRALFWTLRALFQSDVTDRARHFRAVARGQLTGATGR